MKKIMNSFSIEEFIKVVGFIFLVCIVQSCASDEPSTTKEVGFKGVIADKLSNQPVQDATLTFSKIDDEQDVTIAKTDAQGAYKVTLKPAKYFVKVTATGYFPFTTSDFSEVTSRGGYQTKDFSLETEEVGFQGVVSSMATNQPVNEAIITFSRSDQKDVAIVKTNAQGSYKIKLKPAKYYVTVTAIVNNVGFNSYTSAPGFLVVTGVDGYQTGNFFMETEVYSGFGGIVANVNNYQVLVSDAYISFSFKDNPYVVYSTYSNANGGYKINLPQGGYYVSAQAAGYKVYDTTPGLFVVTGANYQTGNIFLTPL